jgi:PAS domain S-box-containing protein
MKFYFEKRLLIGFFSTIVVLVILGIFSFYSTQRLIRASELLTHQLSVINVGDLVIKSVLDMEAGERGYVITGDSIFLEAVHNASLPLNKCFRKLDSLTATDPEQVKRVDSLRHLIAEKREWSEHISVVRKQGFDSARAMIAEGTGRRMTNTIRSCVLRLQQYERESFRKSNTIKESSLRHFQLSFVGLALASTLIIIYLFYLINKTLKARNIAEKKLGARLEARDQKLEETDYIYRSLAANIPGTAITILDREERYLLAEGDLLPKMGYSKEAMPGKKISEIITPKNYEYYEGLIRRAFAGETILVERQTLSGYYTLMKVVPLKNRDNKIFAIMFVLIDVSEIKKTQFELSELNNALEAKVAERTTQLRELNNELEAFTYSVSHDLRAPLRAISGYAQILKEDYAASLDEEGNRVSNVIIANSIRMGKLIDDLLDFSHVGRKELSREPINMDSLVSEVLKELTTHYTPENLTVRRATLEPANGDIDMMRQVWVNLISNALKYSGKKDISIIEIGSFKSDDMITYYISDNGAGFDMQYADKLFGVFQRLHKTQDFEGTGVGLALVNTIIKKHNGRIWAESKPDQGAKFYFTIPIA